MISFREFCSVSNDQDPSLSFSFLLVPHTEKNTPSFTCYGPTKSLIFHIPDRIMVLKFLKS